MELPLKICHEFGEFAFQARVGWADVRKPNIWGHHRPMNVGLRTSAQPTGSMLVLN